MDFILATKNPKKLKEMQRILMPLGISVKCEADFDFPFDEVEENGTTFEENALLKARSASLQSGLPAISDDSGLCVDAIDGEPGVYSARYSDEGTDEANNIKLLSKLNDVEEDMRTARFVCSVCCYFSEDNYFFVNGKCEGKIARKAHGNGGFGYDPLFIVGDLSFAEMTAEQKDECSHRGEAMRLLYDKLKEVLK
ncbi:MAG: RdgB/HAM1 family non-canonical purine NTP pyrophosphatase [Clostridia bacterium]|nr:RdgB/HAM1 family non-canonical purine NTP pyrophosphatase [Clostridia bacterium]